VRFAKLAAVLIAGLCASCLETPGDIPREVKGVVVDRQTQRPIARVKVSVELKRDAVSGYGHTVKEWKTLVVSETEVDGRFAVDLAEHRNSSGKDKQGRTLRGITFEKDHYETVVKQSGEDWSRTELKLAPPK
jgi:hypothetical protein